MSGNLFGSQKWLRFHIWLIFALYYKMRQMLLQNVRGVLVQNARNVYYKMCQVFKCKMRQFY